MNHTLENPHQYDPPPEWDEEEDERRERERSERDDLELHRQYDEGVRK